jgi:hypothetical protein
MGSCVGKDIRSVTGGAAWHVGLISAVRAHKSALGGRKRAMRAFAMAILSDDGGLPQSADPAVLGTGC